MNLKLLFSCIFNIPLQNEKFTHEMRDGWGLATDGEILYGSDGSSSLYHLDPLTFRGYFFFIFFNGFC